MGRVMTEEAQFNELYLRTHDKVARYCLRRLPPDDAKEAMTDTYVVAWRRFSDVPSSNEAVLWLYGIARNVIRNHARSARRSGPPGDPER